MPPSCCPTCRLLALDDAPCVHCGTITVEPRQLARPVISGITAITKQPPSGFRDFLAITATSLGIIGGFGVGALLLGPPGLLLGAAVGIFGYTKQYWRTALKRQDRIVGVAPPRRPPGERLVGIAQPLDRTLDVPDARPQPLAVATTILLEGKVIARRIESVPFWLVLSDTYRILVDGPLWLASYRPELRDNAAAREVIVSAGIPLPRSQRRKCKLVRTILCAHEQLGALGPIAPEQLFGGGYRDHLVNAMRGAPGAPLWLERYEPND